MKMTVSRIFNEAKAKLQYDDQTAVSVISDIDKRMVRTVNEVYTEIFYKIKDTGFKPLSSASDEVDLDEKIIYLILIPGVASRIAFDYGDGTEQAYYANEYNNGLRTLNKINSISDAIPNP